MLGDYTTCSDPHGWRLNVAAMMHFLVSAPTSISINTIINDDKSSFVIALSAFSLKKNSGVNSLNSGSVLKNGNGPQSGPSLYSGAQGRYAAHQLIYSGAKAREVANQCSMWPKAAKWLIIE